MTIGELVYKQAIEQGYNPDLFKGLVSPLNKAMESYKKAFETMKEPLSRVNSAVDSIRPQFKSIENIKLPQIPEINHTFSDIEDCFIKPQDRIQKVEIINTRENVEDKETNNESVLCSYKLPKGATWESLFIKFLDGHVVRVEYPGNSGQWYQGSHEPLITKELFDKAQDRLKRDKIVRENREFAFTKLFTCGMCDSGITAQEKYKELKDGTTAKYVYYSCSKSKDRNCKNKYIREEELIEELFKIIDKVSINELGMRMKLEEEIKRFNRLQRLATKGTPKYSINEDDVNTREYAKYVLREGTPLEKRELLGHLRSRLVLNDKRITLLEE